MSHSYGWVPDRPDPRDFVGALSVEEMAVTVPPSVSLRTDMPPVYDQGQLGSCTANAIAGAVQYQQLKQGEPEGQNVPSRLFIYYNERALEGTVTQDAGASIRDGIKVVSSQGVPPETTWPYDIAQFAAKPPNEAYQDALNFRTLSYARPIRTAYYLRNVLAVGRPFVFGFVVYESFESQQVATTGIVPMPDITTEQQLGGHAVMCVGYKWDNGHLVFEVRNSWGPDYGDAGYLWFPASYLLDTSLAWDFWDLRLES